MNEPTTEDLIDLGRRAVACSGERMNVAVEAKTHVRTHLVRLAQWSAALGCWRICAWLLQRAFVVTINGKRVSVEVDWVPDETEEP